MIIPIVGPTYQMDAVSFDLQRCLNMYPILSEAPNSKSVAALRATPGLELFTTVGGGPIRGAISTKNKGRAFVVSGFDFYEVFSDGTSTLIGTLLTPTGQVSIAENPTQIMIVDGTYGYIYDRNTSTFAQILDADFPACDAVSFQDGYFLVTEKDTAKFYISALNDGSSWDALDFATVESSPDDLVAVISDNQNVWLFGEKVTEVYQNTGDATFPFQRIQGAIVETGCAAAHTVKKLDNTLYWLGLDEQGSGVVWRAEGYNAIRVSTQAIEKQIQTANDFTESYAWVYHQQGHAFYCLQVKGLGTTLVYDVSTQLWHERAYRDNNLNEYQPHRASCHFFFFQNNLVGDRENGNIYKLSLNAYSDNGDPLFRDRITPWYHAEKHLITHAQLELDCEVGRGDVAEPQIMMRYTDDGRNWSNWLYRSLGEIGEYSTRVKWNKLGMSRNRVYQIRVTDACFFQVNEAYLNGP